MKKNYSKPTLKIKEIKCQTMLLDTSPSPNQIRFQGDNDEEKNRAAETKGENLWDEEW